ncbi:MAG TPA: hypothetical protein VGN01_17640 [Acidobacteriaceae bacterium]|jgi:hypothetical protein
MSLLVWLDLRGMDIAAFVLMDILGYLVGTMVPPGTAAVLTSILVSYHLFLAWLVFTSDRRATVAFPIFLTLATHAACLALIIPIGVAGQVIPLFGLFRFLIAAFAVFERGWLFRADVVEHEPERVPEAPVIASTPEDFAAWQQYLAQQKPGSRPHGVSIKAEYEQWVRARHAPPAPPTTAQPQSR